MPKIFKCDVCGLDKTLTSHKKDGSTFQSCPNWKDEEHEKVIDVKELFKSKSRSEELENYRRNTEYENH